MLNEYLLIWIITQRKVQSKLVKSYLLILFPLLNTVTNDFLKAYLLRLMLLFVNNFVQIIIENYFS
jgi:hypothetical protein